MITGGAGGLGRAMARGLLTEGHRFALLDRDRDALAASETALQEAIDAPSFQTDHMPSSFWPRAADLGSLSVEARLPESTKEELAERGHRVSEVDGWSLGRLSAAKREDGMLKAAANPRFMQGYAIGR